MRYSMPVSASVEKTASGLAPLWRFAALWRQRVDGPLRRAAVAVAVASIFALAHLARIGSPAARIATGAALLALWVGLLVRAVLRRRAWRRPEEVVARTIVATHPEL